MARKKIFTIFDRMEENGVFDENPANRGARDKQGRQLYKGPVAFPKMVYHPEGHFAIVTPAEAIATPFGAKMVGERRDLVNKIVHDEEEYAEAHAAGWLDTPAAALAKNPGRLTAAEIAAKALPDAPSGSAAEAAAGALAAKDREIAELKAKLAAVEDL